MPAFTTRIFNLASRGGSAPGQPRSQLVASTSPSVIKSPSATTTPVSRGASTVIRDKIGRGECRHFVVHSRT